MRNLTVSALTLALILFGARAAGATSLSALFTGGSIVAGDLTFDQFTLGSFASSPSRTPNYAGIDVTALSSGLSYAIVSDVLYTSGDESEELIYTFRVTAGPGFQISGDSLSLDDGAIGFGNVLRDTGILISEQPGSLAVQLSIVQNTFTGVFLATSPLNAGAQSYLVTTDIQLHSILNDTAAVNAFSQSFSAQAVPEPVTLLLLGTGLAAVAARRRFNSRS